MLKLRLIAIDIHDWHPPDEVLLRYMPRYRASDVNLRVLHPSSLLFQIYEQLLGLLYDEQAAARIRRYRHARDRLGNLLGRLVPLLDLCTSSSRYTWKQLAQAKEPAGRPYLVNKATSDRIPYYDFNISHDESMLLVSSCYSTSGEEVPLRLGADVMRLGLPEGIPSIAEFEETVKDLLAPDEKKTVMGTEDQEKLQLLMHYWATKEAASKAIGAGLSYGYEKLDASAVRETGELQLPELGKTCQVKDWETPGMDGAYLCVLALLPNANKQAYLEVEPSLETLQLKRLDVNELVQMIMLCATASE